MVDPFAHTDAGVFSASGVRVRRRIGSHRTYSDRHALCTPRFCARRHGGVLDVEHDLRPDELSDELAILLVEELDNTGVLHGQAEFELVFTGIVRSTVDGAMPAWLRFYRNSLDRLEDGVAAFAPVHEHAASLLVGSRVVDLGSCFGFLPLRVAAAGMDVVATDLSAPTMKLLARVSRTLRRRVQTICCDAARVPLPDRDADTVTVVHLLEHLTAGAADDVLEEALRLARRRVVVAVPFEDEPRACYGHIQRFDIAALRRLAVRLRRRHSGLRAGVHEYHGGWLILDR
jgi:Methyltransferase domain